MQIDRPNMIYRNGLLAEQHRERTSNTPVRYRVTWTIHRVVLLEPGHVEQHDRHWVITDDTGCRFIYARTEQIGAELSKREAVSLLVGAE